MAQPWGSSALSALAPRLDAAGGTVSVWCSPADGPVLYAREAAAPHYAASTIKVAIMVAAYRLHERGELDLDADVAVHADFDSVVEGRFTMPQDYDNDDQPWERLGRTASLRWLVSRMIVSSSNLATDLVLEQVGYGEAAALLTLADADGVQLHRPICDDAASAAGVQNTVTAAGLAALFSALLAGRLAGSVATGQMLAVLRGQEHLEGIAWGLPARTVLASKGGWVEGIRHDVALIWPPVAPAYVLAVCTTGLSDDAGLAVLHDVARASWTDLGGSR